MLTREGTNLFWGIIQHLHPFFNKLILAATALKATKKLLLDLFNSRNSITNDKKNKEWINFPKDYSHEL